MNRSELLFDRPTELFASAPPEMRGHDRDDVRLIVSTPEGDTHHAFTELPWLLDPGDLLVVNESATLPASLPATGRLGEIGFTSQLGSLMTSGSRSRDGARQDPAHSRST